MNDIVVSHTHAHSLTSGACRSIPAVRHIKGCARTHAWTTPPYHPRRLSSWKGYVNSSTWNSRVDDTHYISDDRPSTTATNATFYIRFDRLQRVIFVQSFHARPGTRTLAFWDCRKVNNDKIAQSLALTKTCL